MCLRQIPTKYICLVFFRYVNYRQNITIFQPKPAPAPDFVSHPNGSIESTAATAAMSPGPKPYDAGSPLVIWGLLVALITILSTLGVVYVGKSPRSLGKSLTADQMSFTGDVKSACIKNQRTDANRKLGITEQQMDTFCGCLADSLVKELTIGEVNTMMAVRPGPLPISVQEKANRLAPDCRRLTLGR